MLYFQMAQLPKFSHSERPQKIACTEVRPGMKLTSHHTLTSVKLRPRPTLCVSQGNFGELRDHRQEATPTQSQTHGSAWLSDFQASPLFVHPEIPLTVL